MNLVINGTSYIFSYTPAFLMKYNNFSKRKINNTIIDLVTKFTFEIGINEIEVLININSCTVRYNYNNIENEVNLIDINDSLTYFLEM